jgi:ComF family protein
MVNGRLLAWLSWLWPERCALCRAPIGAGKDFCAGCHADLPWIKTGCPTCAAPSSSSARCGRCQRKPPAMHRTYAALRYAEPVDRLIVGLKYRRRLDLARALAQLLLPTLQKIHTRPDIVLPVPLHSARLRERGYNQALEIARVLARRLKLPLATDAVRRTRATATQTTLPRTQRARNVRNAFAVRTDELNGKHVAIVDDVMTSGHTIDALAKVLRRAGAKEISVWIIARA